MASSSSRARRKQERAEADQAMVTAHRRVRARYISMVTLSLTLAVIALLLWFDLSIPKTASFAVAFVAVFPAIAGWYFGQRFRRQYPEWPEYKRRKAGK